MKIEIQTGFILTNRKTVEFIETLLLIDAFGDTTVVITVQNDTSYSGVQLVLYTNILLS